MTERCSGESTHVPSRPNDVPRHELVLLSPYVFHGLFLLYALMCLVFYKERLHLDVARFLDYGVLQGRFFRLFGRDLGQIPPQLPAFAALKLGLPLREVARAFSVGFCLSHYAIGLVLFYGFKRRDLALLLIVLILVYLVHANVLAVADGMHVGAWALLLHALLDTRPDRAKRKLLRALAVPAVAVAVASVHPFGVALVVYLCGYAVLSHPQRRATIAVSLVTLLSLAGFLLLRRANVNSYELSHVSDLSLATFRANWRGFIPYFLFAHGLALLCASALFLLGAQHKEERWKMCFSLSAALGYALLIVGYVRGGAFAHFTYLWHCFMPMYFILLLPLLATPAGSTPRKRIPALIFTIALCWAVVGSAGDFSMFRIRAEFFTNVLEAGQRGEAFKYLLDNPFSTDPVKTWSPQFIADEVLLSTAFDGPDGVAILTPWHKLDGLALLRPQARNLNTTFFGFSQISEEGFVPLVSAAPQAAILQRAESISLTHPARPTSWRIVDGHVTNYREPPKIVYDVPVTVRNDGDGSLPTFDEEGNAVLFGYYWVYRGELVFQNTHADLVPLDIRHTYRHRLNVKRDGIPGDAQLFVDLFLAGRPLTTGEHFGGLTYAIDYKRKLREDAARAWRHDPVDAWLLPWTDGDGIARMSHIKIKKASNGNHATASTFDVTLPPHSSIMRLCRSQIVPGSKWTASAEVWGDSAQPDKALVLQLASHGTGPIEGNAIGVAKLGAAPKRYEATHVFNRGHDCLRFQIENTSGRPIRFFLRDPLVESVQFPDRVAL
ncbi:MAG: hypothetical protein GWP08_10130 [Nitrospiraceae bacterium]|nr:hypothetical protein [Nitrospiraceae bacterium]